MERHCKHECKRYGELVTLYQDGPIAPNGIISWRCPECLLYDFEFTNKANLVVERIENGI